MFDVDGDGLISYTEYLLLITFLSIPVEVSIADCMLDKQQPASATLTTKDLLENLIFLVIM